MMTAVLYVLVSVFLKPTLYIKLSLVFIYTVYVHTCTDPDPVCIRIYDSNYYLLNCFHISTQCPDLYVTSILIATWSDSNVYVPDRGDHYKGEAECL